MDLTNTREPLPSRTQVRSTKYESTDGLGRSHEIFFLLEAKGQKSQAHQIADETPKAPSTSKVVRLNRLFRSPSPCANLQSRPPTREKAVKHHLHRHRHHHHHRRDAIHRHLRLSCRNSFHRTTVDDTRNETAGRSVGDGSRRRGDQYGLRIGRVFSIPRSERQSVDRTVQASGCVVTEVESTSDAHSISTVALPACSKPVRTGYFDDVVRGSVGSRTRETPRIRFFQPRRRAAATRSKKKKIVPRRQRRRSSRLARLLSTVLEPR